MSGSHGGDGSGAAAEALVYVSAYLSADTRLLAAAAVCRAWRAALDAPSLWYTLTLSPEAQPRDALLNAAAARARGRLTTLDVRSCDHLTSAALAAVLRANGGALEHVNVTCGASERVLALPALRDLLAACGPQLRELHADVQVARPADAVELLAAAPPFGALRCRCLRVSEQDGDDGGEEDAWSEEDVVALAEGIAVGPGGAHLQALNVTGVQLPRRALDAVVDGALARRLRQMHFSACGLDVRSVAPLVRLLDGGAVTDFLLFDCRLDRDGDNAAAAAADGEALFRAIGRCASLRTLSLAHTTLSLPTRACLLQPHCVGHPSLQSLTLYECYVGRHVLAYALVALVRANAPALRTLRVALAPARPGLDRHIGGNQLASMVGGALSAGSPLTALALAPAPRANSPGFLELRTAVHAATRLRQLELGGSASEVAAAAEEGAPLLDDEVAALVRFVAERARAAHA
jgi:hypothetical protein